MNAIEVSGLRFEYDDNKPVLADISFSVAEGECVGLIGPNGAGKSTLLLHLNGILPEEKKDVSQIRIFDEPISRDNLDRIRRAVGLLFQNPDDQLFCPTIFEDVAFGPQQFGMNDAELKTSVERALAEAGLHGYENRSPHHLSHGEKRRVCLAGLFACNPRILLLDEPTSDLDPRGRRELKALLKQLPVTRLIASHDLEMIVELCSRVIVLDKGRIVAKGRTMELLNNEALMHEHGLETPHILRHAHPH
jgi:cobalt/nickel transport system ATP-binding protein